MSEEKRNYATEDFDIVDLYITYNPNEAEFLKDMLDENDIACFIRDMQPGQFPMSVGIHGQHRVVVDEDKVREAFELIKAALEDGAITNEGQFVWEG